MDTKQATLDPNNDKLITLAQAAEMLDVHEETIRRWGKAGKINVVRIATTNRPRLKMSDVLALIRDGKMPVSHVG